MREWCMGMRPPCCWTGFVLLPWPAHVVWEAHGLRAALRALHVLAGQLVGAVSPALCCRGGLVVPVAWP